MMAFKVKRGKCKQCGRSKALRKDGTVRAHPAKGGDPYARQNCAGTGQRPS